VPSRVGPVRDLAAGVRTYWSVHPLGLPTSFSPSSSRMAPAEVRRSSRPASRSCPLYLGLAALLVLALLTRSGGRPGSSRASASPLPSSPRRHAPVYGALTTLVPPLRILRYPVKALTCPLPSGPRGLGGTRGRGPRKRGGCAVAVRPSCSPSWPRPAGDRVSRGGGWLEPSQAHCDDRRALRHWPRRRPPRPRRLAGKGRSALCRRHHPRRRRRRRIWPRSAPLNRTAFAHVRLYRPAVFRAVSAELPAAATSNNHVAVVGKSHAPGPRLTHRRRSRRSGIPRLRRPSPCGLMFPARPPQWGLTLSTST
jgi:hypothetical protein